MIKKAIAAGLCICAAGLTACGNSRPPAGIEAGRASGEYAGAAGEDSGSAAPEDEGRKDEKEQTGDIPAGLIEEQTFDVVLDGWGEVTFASFLREENGKSRVIFQLLKDGQAVYSFPERNGASEDGGSCFYEVDAVSFNDYNEDGKTDVIILGKYGKSGADETGGSWKTVRLYTQPEQEKEFITDDLTAEYLMKNLYNESMDSVMEGLENYSKWYFLSTTSSIWEVERFAQRIKNQLLNGEWDAVAESISYPIVIDGRTYQDSDEFLAAGFDMDLSEEFREGLEMESCRHMFVNYQGIMLGVSGQVWIADVPGEEKDSNNLKIIALNGLTAG